MGNKADSLLVLQGLGLNVPAFIVVDDFDSVDGEAILGRFESENSALARSYAVRSNAAIEDSPNESLAGQFMTKIDVKPEDLEEAINEIVVHSRAIYKALGLDYKNDFSVIIQEYVEAEFSGVLFTRNPLGGREMVVEYFKGIGENIVSGKVKPHKESFYWSQDVPSSIPAGKYLVENAKKCEEFFKFPQDIEWSFANGKLYFLQSRAITTLSKDAYNEMRYVDKFLKTHVSEDRFLFEKDEISEIAPRPHPITKSLLDRIYKQGGPVNQVYYKYGIKYKSQNFLKIIGNELYTDKEKEIKTLMPAYSYMNEDFVLKMSSFAGLLGSLINSWKINRLALFNFSDLRHKLKFRLKDKLNDSLNIAQRLELFMEDYKLIFEINLLATKSVKILESVLRKEDVEIPRILSCSFESDYVPVIAFDDKGMKGNSLDFADESDFSYSYVSPPMHENIKAWYKSLNDLQRRLYLPRCIQAQKFNRLRENARWLTVKMISYLREALIESDLVEGKDIYYATFDEILKAEDDGRDGDGSVDEVDGRDCYGEVDKMEAGENEANDRKAIDDAVIKSRKKDYLSFSDMSLESRITSHFKHVESKHLGVSAGIASGVLTELKDLALNEKSEKYVNKKILYVEVLSPNLTKYFDQIDGIISKQGGLLSHLAIMAREKEIPVVTGVSREDLIVDFGEMIGMDGGDGQMWDDKE